MKKNLTILLVLACGLSLDISQAQTPEQPLDEIVVPMSALLGEHGYLETLRNRGHEVLAPGVDRP